MVPYGRNVRAVAQAVKTQMLQGAAVMSRHTDGRVDGGGEAYVFFLILSASVTNRLHLLLIQELLVSLVQSVQQRLLNVC